jgi:hypothetical protein
MQHRMQHEERGKQKLQDPQSNVHSAARWADGRAMFTIEETKPNVMLMVAPAFMWVVWPSEPILVIQARA